MASKGIRANYLAIENAKFTQGFVDIEKVFGLQYDDEDIYFAFESQHTPYQKFVIGTLPRTDLVIQRKSSGSCMSGLEVKLTALPDESTFDLPEKSYSCEIVVRPDTIVYLACSIATNLGSKLNSIVPNIQVEDWTEPVDVLKKVPEIVSFIEDLSFALEAKQSSFLVQPIWKTRGKSPVLSENCLDVFVWSDAGFAYFVSSIADSNPAASNITRPTRTAVWLYKMLQEIKDNGRFDPKTIRVLTSIAEIKPARHSHGKTQQV
ncbi:MAG: restriction endonuclease, partial [Candidatus Lambdaproteobacteria bacterium RIFOXYC1_FULL_56_13]